MHRQVLALVLFLAYGNASKEGTLREWCIFQTTGRCGMMWSCWDFDFRVHCWSDACFGKAERSIHPALNSTSHMLRSMFQLPPLSTCRPEVCWCRCGLVQSAFQQSRWAHLIVLTRRYDMVILRQHGLEANSTRWRNVLNVAQPVFGCFDFSFSCKESIWAKITSKVYYHQFNQFLMALCLPFVHSSSP